MNDPENKDLKPQDDTAEQPNAAQQESDGTELSDEELGDAAGGAPPSFGVWGTLDDNPNL